MARTGPDNPRWNQGGYVKDEGYIMIYVGVEHPLADPKGYAYLHKLVWASSGRRMPTQDEVIHHKDECKQRNCLDNMELKTRPHHGVYHARKQARQVGKFAKGEG